MKTPTNYSKQLTLIESGDEIASIELDKPVSLIHMTNNLTAHQRKGFNAILTLAKQQLDKDKDDSLAKVEIPWIDFKRIMRLKHRTQKHALEKMRELQQITVEIDILGAEGIRTELRSLQLVSEVRIGNDSWGDTLITIFLPPTIRERLRDSDIRAVLNMSEMATLTSKFSMPLYELCMDAMRGSDGKSIVVFSFEIDTFKRLMDISKGYDRTFDLQKRCIDVAVDEIHELTDLRLTYKLIKGGRGNKVHSVEFSVFKDDKDAVKFQILFNDTIVHVREGYQENNQVIQAVESALREKGFDFTVSNIVFTNINSRKNYVKYLKDALEGDYAINDRVKKKQEEKVVRTKRDEESVLALEAAEQQAREDADLVKLFDSYSEDKKEEIYALIEIEERTNPFGFSRLTSGQQIAFVMRKFEEETQNG